jgi:hypothetical protein
MARQSRHSRRMGIPQVICIIVQRWAGFKETWKNGFEVLGAVQERTRGLLPVGLPLARR